MIARRYRRVAVGLAVAAIGLGLTGCSSPSSDAATITYRDASGSHTVHISRSEFVKELGELAGSAQFQTLLKDNSFPLAGDQKLSTGADLSTTYLSQLVEQTAADAEVSSLKIPLDTSSTAEANALLQAKESFALNSEVSQDSQGNQTFTGTGVVYASFPKSLQKLLVDRQLRSDALANYFANPSLEKEQALYAEFGATICPSGRVVDQILVKDKATADAILAQLKSGASFAALAKVKSTDTTSAKVGGSVGCLSKGTFVKEFETAAYAAPFDTPVGPVKSQYGYHVLLVRHPTFADSQAELTTALQQNPLIARDLRLQSMKVWINPQLGTGALAVDSQRGALVYQITPPAAPALRTCREKTAGCAPPTTTTTTVPAGG